METKRYKEFDVARVFAIFCMILVHLMFAIYDNSNETIYLIVDFLGSPFAAPVFMFIMGANMELTTHKRPKSLFKRGLIIFFTSLVFNIICHALPFFVMDSVSGTSTYGLTSVHWIFAVDILTFSGLAFMLMALLKKGKMPDKLIGIFAIFLSFMNVVLCYLYPVNFTNNILGSSLASLFYTAGDTGYFSLFGWFIFPAAGYIYIRELKKHENEPHFRRNILLISLAIYFIMILGQTHLVNGKPLINPYDEYSYYRMHTYGGLMNVAFCIAWINIVYYITKIIPDKLYKKIKDQSVNLTNIYLTQWFIINYGFVLLFNDTLRVGPLGLFISFIILLTLTFIFAYLYKKIKKYLNKE